MVKNLPGNARDTASIHGPGRPHLPPSHKSHAHLLSLRSEPGSYTCGAAPGRRQSPRARSPRAADGSGPRRKPGAAARSGRRFAAGEERAQRRRGAAGGSWPLGVRKESFRTQHTWASKEAPALIFFFLSAPLLLIEIIDWFTSNCIY